MTTFFQNAAIQGAASGLVRAIMRLSMDGYTVLRVVTSRTDRSQVNIEIDRPLATDADITVLSTAAGQIATTTCYGCRVYWRLA